MSDRMKPKERRAQILGAAVIVAARFGYLQMTREDIASEAGVSNALVSKYFNTMTQMRRAALRRAIKIENHAVIAQGVVAGDKAVSKISEELKAAALASV